MMHKSALLTCFLFLFLSLSTKAQDKIISIHQDTIHCKIVSINNECIVFELKNKDGSVTGKIMNLSQVAEYSRSSQPVHDSKSSERKLLRSVNVPDNFWCFGLSGGGSTMPWYFDNLQVSNMPDYYAKLKTGFHINASAHYMMDGFWGLGAEYSFFNKSFSGSMPVQYSQSLYIVTQEKYRQYINYVGPSVLFVQQLGLRRKFMLSESFSAGALFVRLENQATYQNVDNSGYTDVANNSLFTGNTFSAKFGLNAEYRVDSKVSVGLGGSYVWALLKKASFESRGSNNHSSSSENEELSPAMDLSRIDYSIVLRYKF